MAPYFPASHANDIKVGHYTLSYSICSSCMLQIEQNFDEFNLVFCALTSLLVKASETSTLSLHAQRKLKTYSRTLHPRTGKFSSLSMSTQTERVTEYIIRRLEGEVKRGIVVPITHSAYVALLPSIWSLISNSSSESSKLLNALLDHALRVPSKSPCKRATVEFVGRLFLVS